MIHLVTDHSALLACLQHRLDDEPIMLWGNALSHHRAVLEAVTADLCWIMADDAERYRIDGLQVITPEAWINALTAHPCQTWS